MKVKLGFIGAGHMANAFMRSIANNKDKLDYDVIYVYDRNDDRMQLVKDIATPCVDETELALKSDIIFLCVRPQSFAELLSKIVNLDLEGKQFVSVAAGISINHIALSLHVPVIRLMPNTLMEKNLGAVAISCSKDTPEQMYNYVYKLISSSSYVLQIDESKMNGVVSLNGSSPAYFYEMVKNMTLCAKEFGFSEKDAINTIKSVMQGVASNLENKSLADIEELISKICTKGGTTEAAINAMKENGFEKAINSGMKACTKRSSEIASDID